MTRRRDRTRQKAASGADRARQPSRAVLLAPIIGASFIVTFAWTAALLRSIPEIFTAGAIVFALLEGLIFAFVGASWSSRGIPLAVAVAVLTAVLATPARWYVTYLLTNRVPNRLDLVSDAGTTLAWAIFAGFVGATTLRRRLSALLPN